MPTKVVLALTPHLEIRQVPKFRRAAPPNSEVIVAHLFHFKPILHVGDLARKEKIKKNIMRKTEVLPKTIVFRRTNKPQQILSPLPQAIACGRTNYYLRQYHLLLFTNIRNICNTKHNLIFV